MKSASPFFVAYICYVFMTCESTGVVETSTPKTFVRELTENEDLAHTRGRDVVSECRNRTLRSSDLEILPNGSVRIRTLDLVLNSSAAHTQVGGDAVTICAPEREHKISVRTLCKPIYFSVLAFVFQLQVPVVACLNRGFHRIAPPLLASFLACLVSAYYIVPADLWMNNPAFFSVWISAPSILNLISLTSVAWMCLLSSDPVVHYLKSLDHITVTKGSVIVIKRFSGILQLSFFLGSGIVVFTFVTIHSGMIEGYTLLPREFDSMDKMLPFFFPSFLILTIVNVFFFAVGRVFPPKGVADDLWPRLREKNWLFFHLHMFVVANWTFGCVIVICDVWWVWNMFACMSIMVPWLILRATCVPDKRPQRVIADKISVDLPDGQSALLTIKVDNPVKGTTL